MDSIEEHSSKRWLIILIILIVLTGTVIGLALVFFSGNNPFLKSNPISQTQTKPSPSPKINYAKSLQKTIQVTFTPDQQKDIAKYISIATTTSDSSLAYKSSVQAYLRMADIYQQTKDPKVKQAIIELKDYSKIFDQYQDKDMSISI